VNERYFACKSSTPLEEGACCLAAMATVTVIYYIIIYCNSHGPFLVNKELGRPPTTPTTLCVLTNFESVLVLSRREASQTCSLLRTSSSQSQLFVLYHKGKKLYDPKRTIVDLNERPCDGDSSLRCCLARLHGSIKLPYPHPPRISLSSGTTTTIDVSSLVCLSYPSLSATEQSRLQR
jgi:hypothetical protein